MGPIPIIDLFAGPGGLGEGFMSLKKKGASVFDIKLSIEKDENAHATLIWRSFYRQFDKTGSKVPDIYYQAYAEADIKEREGIIRQAFIDYPKEGEEALKEVKLIELGSEDWPAEKVDELIVDRLGESPSDWLLIGGPPCQAYSNVGRSRVGGIDKDDKRVYLYQEYLRIIKKHSPAVFVMENVQGLLSAKIEGESVFEKIKKDLGQKGKFRIFSFVKDVKENRDYLIKSEQYGIPQKRHRVILLGIRSDLKHTGEYLEKSGAVTLGSIIGAMPAIRSGISKRFLKHDPSQLNALGTPKRIYKNVEDSDKLWQKLIFGHIDRIAKWGEIPLNGLTSRVDEIELGVGAEFVECQIQTNANSKLNNWYFDKRLSGLANNQSRSHLVQDLMRYLFAALYVQKHNKFPRLEDFASHHKDLIPDHANVASGKFVDRFRVQMANCPATTVTSHISKDGHYFIHYDPQQCRSLTVREAARIQTFPDNYLFRGSRTAQYHQVGNAVPPYLARKIANIVEGIFRQNG